MWIDLNNSDVDFAIGDAHTIGPYTYSPKPDKVAFTSGTSVERLSDYNIKWATNGHWSEVKINMFKNYFYLSC